MKSDIPIWKTNNDGATLDYIEPEVLKAVVETNDKVRENRDWEDMRGRAVVL